MKISLELGRAVYLARKALGLTQAQVAERAGISIRWYQRVEKGDVDVGFSICARIARVLKIDLNRLVYVEGEANESSLFPV